MFENMKLADGSKWIRYGGRRVTDGFTYVNKVNNEFRSIFLPNGAGSNDSFEIYLSGKIDSVDGLVAVVTWDRRYQYVGGVLYNKQGEELTEFFAQDESSEEFFKLSEANMIKHMIYMLHQLHP